MKNLIEEKKNPQNFLVGLMTLPSRCGTASLMLPVEKRSEDGTNEILLGISSLLQEPQHGIHST